VEQFLFLGGWVDVEKLIYNYNQVQVFKNLLLHHFLEMVLLQYYSTD
jgi:hypothetical protein